MNALRRELAGLLAETPARRRPALRRSRDPAYLYATDLPLTAERADTERFLSAAKARGWRTTEADGWLLADKTPETPPEGWYAGPYGAEAVCCARLLRLHPGGADGSDAIRRLLKAGEEGPDALETLCGVLHAEWAARLRLRAELPDVSAAYFEKN